MIKSFLYIVDFYISCAQFPLLKMYENPIDFNICYCIYRLSLKGNWPHIQKFTLSHPHPPADPFPRLTIYLQNLQKLKDRVRFHDTRTLNVNTVSNPFIIVLPSSQNSCGAGSLREDEKSNAKRKSRTR